MYSSLEEYILSSEAESKSITILSTIDKVTSTSEASVTNPLVVETEFPESRSHEEAGCVSPTDRRIHPRTVVGSNLISSFEEPSGIFRTSDY